MPTAALLVAAGLGQSPGFEVLERDPHCVYLVNDPGPNAWPTLRAECLWEGVDVARLERVLGDWGGYADTFSTIDQSVVVGRMGAATAVQHVHTAPLSADRQALLLMWDEPAGTGRAFRWTLAPGQPETARGRVQVLLDIGHWTVAPNPVGAGSIVITELTYDPGGRVPDVLVVWFQQLGAAAFVEELKGAVSD